MNENVSALRCMTESDLRIDCAMTVGPPTVGSSVRTDAVRLSVTIFVSSLRFVVLDSALLTASSVRIVDDVTFRFCIRRQLAT